MAAGGPWMPIYWGDYLGDTAHLTLEQHGAYLLLIAAYWRRGKPLPDDEKQFARILGIGRKRFPALRSALAPFFDIQDGTWRHKRIEIELLKSNARSTAARTAGITSAQRRYQQATTTTIVTEKKEAQQEAALGLSHAQQAVALADQLAEIAGVSTTSQPGFAVASEIITWLESGCDPERDIKPAVADVVARLKAGGKPMPRSWSYFRNSVTERRDARRAGLPMRPVNGYDEPGKPRMIAAAAARETFKPEPDPSAHLSPKERAEIADRVKARVMASLKRAP